MNNPDPSDTAYTMCRFSFSDLQTKPAVCLHIPQLFQVLVGDSVLFAYYLMAELAVLHFLSLIAVAIASRE